AFIRHYAAEFGPLPLMVVEKTGYGAGSKIIPEIANCLRIILGQEATGEETDEEVRVSVIETNIDDMNPELFDHIMQGLLALGAVDVYFTPVSMKKNRPAVKLTVLAARKDRETLCRHLLKETSTFGVRWWPADRMVLPRDTRTVATPNGKVRVKRGWMDGRVVHTSPEYEDCRHLAEKGKRSILEVYDAARRCAWDQLAAEEKRGKE
ncbi:MAG: LarC family nickel insertion protein, partial [Nitrospinaceae bacterium]